MKTFPQCQNSLKKITILKDFLHSRINLRNIEFLRAGIVKFPKTFLECENHLGKVTFLKRFLHFKKEFGKVEFLDPIMVKFLKEFFEFKFEKQ